MSREIRTDAPHARDRRMAEVTIYAIQGEIGDWEVVVGLEVYAQATSNATLIAMTSEKCYLSNTGAAR